MKLPALLRTSRNHDRIIKTIYEERMTVNIISWCSEQAMLNRRFLVFLFVVTAVVCLTYCVTLFSSPELLGSTTYKQEFHVNRTKQNARLLSELLRSSYLTTRPFNMSGHDVMVFLHIQKTGGTFFGKNLVKHLRLKRPCNKIFNENARFQHVCKRPNSNEFWLYSRYSTGWVCGLHADWTTWTSCLPGLLKSHLSRKSFNETKLFYITVLRDPVDRFLSELKHIQRGATWKSAVYICGNKKYKPPLCFKGSNWTSVTLTEFLDCRYNLAFNRQTRMLANMTEVGCLSYKKRSFPWSRVVGKIALESAKKNLRSMAYFGLMEYQQESQYLFENTFGLKFKRGFSQVPVNETWSNEAWKTLNTESLLRIRTVNRLDRQLYSYAKALFFKRLKYFQRVNELKNTGQIEA